MKRVMDEPVHFFGDTCLCEHLTNGKGNVFHRVKFGQMSWEFGFSYDGYPKSR